MAEVMIPAWTVGDRLSKARRTAGVKQTEMADFLGVSHASVSAWENDVTPIKLGMLRGYAIRCSVPLEWLRYGVTPRADGTSVSGESWSACTTRLPEVQEELPFGETIEVPAATEPDRTVVPFRRAS